MWPVSLSFLRMSALQISEERLSNCGMNNVKKSIGGGVACTDSVHRRTS